MVYLSVDGVELGAMNNHYVDCRELGAMNHYFRNASDQNATSDWVNGKDFPFNWMSTTTYSSGVLACSIGTYCNSVAAGGTDQAALSKATAVYGCYARGILLK